MKQFTKAVLERAMQAEMTAPSGYEKHDPAIRAAIRAMAKSKNMLKCDFGEQELETPRDGMRRLSHEGRKNAPCGPSFMKCDKSPE